MAPRAKAVTTATRELKVNPKLVYGRKVFYWPDTGPVEVDVAETMIVEARAMFDYRLWGWTAGEGQISTEIPTTEQLMAGSAE